MSTDHDHYLSDRARTTVLPIVVVVTVFLAMVGVLLVTVDRGEGGSPASAPTTTVPPATPEEAIGAWFTAHRAGVFPTYEGAYLGRCETGQIEGACSMFREDLGDHRLYGVGVAATDWGADLLLEREGAAGWAVIAAQPWPVIGEPGAYGPPWSPHTAIARWLATDTSGTFPAGVTYLGACGTSGAIATPGQPLLCGTLVSIDADTRVYQVAPLDEPAVLYMRLVEGTDHVWTVTATAPAQVQGSRLPAPW